VAKAMAAGAETAMVGNLLAGTEESPGTTVTRDGRPVKVYRGMASASAAARRMAVEGVEPPEGTEFTQVVPEGVESTVPYRGPVGAVVYDLVGGLRSAMSYADARTIEEFQANARFVRITSAGLAESHPHGLR
jgi:IMP dehydrogenase